jgi:hypothetical protein
VGPQPHTHDVRCPKREHMPKKAARTKKAKHKGKAGAGAAGGIAAADATLRDALRSGKAAASSSRLRAGVSRAPRSGVGSPAAQRGSPAPKNPRVAALAAKARLERRAAKSSGQGRLPAITGATGTAAAAAATPAAASAVARSPRAPAAASPRSLAVAQATGGAASRLSPRQAARRSKPVAPVRTKSGAVGGFGSFSSPSSSPSSKPPSVLIGEEWRLQIAVGFKCDAQRSVSLRWYEGTVVQVKAEAGGGGKRVKVRYEVVETDAASGGRPADEWMAATSPQLQLLGTNRYGGVHDGLLDFRGRGGALRPLLQRLFDDDNAGTDSGAVLSWQLRLADCGVFAAAQLQAAIMQWSTNQSESKPLASPKFKDKMRRINDLLLTRARPDPTSSQPLPLTAAQLTQAMQLLKDPPATAAAAAWVHAGAVLEAAPTAPMLDLAIETSLLTLDQLDQGRRLAAIECYSSARLRELTTGLGQGTMMLNLPINVGDRSSAYLPAPWPGISAGL